jgi:hypothetical protein
MLITDEAARAAYTLHWHDHDAARLAKVPIYMHGGFFRWVMWGIQPGDFLDAVVRGDLFRAVRLADDENQRALMDWVRLFYNGAPAACFGSEKLAERWITMGGLLGRCTDCNGPLSVPDVDDTTSNDVDGSKVCDRCCEIRANQKWAAQMMGG